MACKGPSLQKAVSAKQRSKYAAFIGNGDSRQIDEKLLMQLQTNKHHWNGDVCMTKQRDF
jgi:hypothetical protein